MSRCALQRFASCLLLALTPTYSFCADSTRAMLYTNGAAWVNGIFVPRTSAVVFSGDLLQTRSDSLANINRPGTIVTVLSDSLVRYEVASLRIEHGGLAVATSEGVAVTAGAVKVEPASHLWTEFNVTDVDGTVRISARKGDIKVDDGNKTVTLAQGQETTRDEAANSGDSSKSSKKKRGAGVAATPAASGGVMNSPYAIAAGAGAIGALGLWVWTRNDDPASPSIP